MIHRSAGRIADVATIMPVFCKGRLAAWVGGLTDVMEVGGTAPGRGTAICVEPV